MSSIDTLRNGLKQLENQYRERKEKLLAELKARRSISEDDQDWLDGAANLVDKACVVETLENAANYESGVRALDTKGQMIVGKLMKLGKGGCKHGIKRKSGHQKKKKKCTGQKENATTSQRVEILDWYHANGKNQSLTAKHFDAIYPSLQIKQPLISSWVKDEAKWRATFESENGVTRSAKRTCMTRHPEVTEMLETWVTMACGDGLLLTGEILRQKWREFADMRCVPQDERLTLSEGWLTRCKERTGLKGMKRHGEAASACPEAVEKERQRIRNMIKESGFAERDIFNMDETGLFYAFLPDRGLSNVRLSGMKSKKVRLTYALTTNADGSEKLPPLIIGKAQKPRAFHNKTGTQLGFHYRSNAKAWMTTYLYQEWISDWDRKLRAKGRRILLLQDNFSGHNPPEGLTNIRVENFGPNLTAHIQPMDQGIIQCFKFHYRTGFIYRSVGNYESGITPSEIYNIDQLEAMRLAQSAWLEVDTSTIRNCWRKANVLPETTHAAPLPPPSLPIASLVHPQEDPVAVAEAQLVAALDELESTGALQRSNRMSISEFLNPPDEAYLVSKTTNEDIYDAVMEARRAREGCQTSQDDIDEDTMTGVDNPVDPIPTRAEALQMALGLSCYTMDKDDDLLQKMDSILVSFRRQARKLEMSSLKESKITSYFVR